VTLVELEHDQSKHSDRMTSRSGSAFAHRHPLVFFYLLSLVLSAVVIAVLLAVDLAEELFVLGTFGPGIAAVVTVAVVDGRSQAWHFVRSMRWRFGLGWWAVAVLLPLAVVGAALLLATFTGGPSLSSELWPGLVSAIPCS